MLTSARRIPPFDQSARGATAGATGATGAGPTGATGAAGATGATGATGVLSQAATHAQFSAFGIAATFAAQPMTDSPVHDAGIIRRLRIVVGKAPAAGESVAITVKVNGVALPGMPVVITSANAAGTFVDVAAAVGTALGIGDELTVDGVYVAGGTPARPDIGVFLDATP